MSTPTILNCVQIDLKMVIDAQTVQNSFYYQFTATPNAFDLNSLAGAVVTAWVTHFKPLLPTVLSLNEVVLTDLTGLTGVRVDFPVNPPEDGGLGGGWIPLNATLAIKRTGAVRGRGTTGRIFWPVMPSTEVASDRVSPTHIAAILAAVAGFDADVVAAAPLGTLPVVPHKAGVHHGTSTPLINWGVADDYIDSQRDRLPRHRRHKKPRVP